MRSVKSFIAAGAATLLSSAAFAADMAIAPPPYAAPVVEDFGGWYLRGDIGFSNQRVERLNNVLRCQLTVARSRTMASIPQASSASASATGSTTGSAPTSPVNIAANRKFHRQQIRHHLCRRRRRHRYLSRQQVRMAGSGQRLCRSRHLVVRDAVHRRRRRLFAGHDLATSPIRPIRQRWRRAAEPRLRRHASKWNFAWALHAGLAYRVTPNFTVELAYRYVEHRRWPDWRSPTFDGFNDINNPMTFKDITSHDLKLGVRWDLSNPPVYAPPPLIRKG